MALADAKFAEADEVEGYVAEVVEVNAADFGVGQKLGDPEWVAHSGSNRHICRDIDLLRDVKLMPLILILADQATRSGGARDAFGDCANYFREQRGEHYTWLWPIPSSSLKCRSTSSANS